MNNNKSNDPTEILHAYTLTPIYKQMVTTGNPYAKLLKKEITEAGVDPNTSIDGISFEVLTGIAHFQAEKNEAENKGGPSILSIP